MEAPRAGADTRPDARAAAFDRLTSARLAACYRLATAILGDPVEAEDATHDAAVRAREHWDSLRDAERFGPWFQRILALLISLAALPVLHSVVLPRHSQGG
jgi:DNA-directed RNA polymerase specialized sigma24 family protein